MALNVNYLTNSAKVYILRLLKTINLQVHTSFILFWSINIIIIILPNKVWHKFIFIFSPTWAEGAILELSVYTATKSMLILKSKGIKLLLADRSTASLQDKAWVAQRYTQILKTVPTLCQTEGTV